MIAGTHLIKILYNIYKIMKMIINRKQIIVGDQWIKILCNNCKKIKIKKFKKTTKKSWIFPLLQSDNLKVIK